MLTKKLKYVEESIKRMELQLPSFVADIKQLTSMFPSIMNAPSKLPKFKLKFPEFDLENIRFWIRRCNSFFQLCQIPDHLKMVYVSLNIKGKAECWYECYVSDHGGSVITGEKFCVDICQRLVLNPWTYRTNLEVLSREEIWMLNNTWKGWKRPCPPWFLPIPDYRRRSMCPALFQDWNQILSLSWLCTALPPWLMPFK